MCVISKVFFEIEKFSCMSCLFSTFWSTAHVIETINISVVVVYPQPHETNRSLFPAGRPLTWLKMDKCAISFKKPKKLKIVHSTGPFWSCSIKKTSKKLHYFSNFCPMCWPASLAMMPKKTPTQFMLCCRRFGVFLFIE